MLPRVWLGEIFLLGKTNEAWVSTCGFELCVRGNFVETCDGGRGTSERGEVASLVASVVVVDSMEESENGPLPTSH